MSASAASFLSSSTSVLKKPVTHCTWKEPLCCDCVEWCPTIPYLFVVANYELTTTTMSSSSSESDESSKKKAKQSKSGGLSLFRHSSGAITSELSGIRHQRFEKHCFVECAAVLDAKWCYLVGLKEPILAVACEDGSLLLYSVVVDPDTKHFTLLLHHSLCVCEPSSSSSSSLQCCLFLDWRIPRNIGSTSVPFLFDRSQMINTPTVCDLAVSLSDGSFAIVSVQIAQSSDPLGSTEEHSSILRSYYSIRGEIKFRSKQIHNDQMWTVCFDHSTHVDSDSMTTLYTGSDDCSLKCFDLRSEETTFVDESTHSGGVCCIEDDWSDPHRLITGAYDDRLRVWDKRMLGRKTVSEWRTTDGVWRVKSSRHGRKTLLIGAMRAGFFILDEPREGGVMSVVCEYNRHHSMMAEQMREHISEMPDILAYGCDWKWDECAEKETDSVVSVSFYDRQLHLWGLVDSSKMEQS